MRRLVFEALSGRFPRHHVAMSRLRQGQRTEAHGHDFPELFLVEEGQGRHFWNGRDLPLAAGDIVRIHPEDQHCFRGPVSGWLTFTNLALAPSWWKGYGALLPPDSLPRGDWPDSPTCRHLDPAEARNCSSGLRRLLEDGGRDPTLLPEVLSLLLRHLRGPAPATEQAPALPEWLGRWRRDLLDPELLPQPLSFWQSRSGRSPEHLARSCRKHLGASPSELLARARVDWVKSRLRRGEDKVAALALDAGFQNLGYFYRCFKRAEGCTPRVWLLRAACAATVPR